jgi:hypothetical protein
MKKVFISLLLFCLCILTAYPQFNSGSLFISGSSSFSLDVSGERWKSSNGESEDAHKNTSISFNPMAGYFLKNRIALGGMMDYSISKYTVSNSTSKSSFFLMGPLARYYFNYSVSGIMPFAEIDAGIGKSSTEYEYEGIPNVTEYSLFRVSGGLGLNYFLNDHIAFETRLKYYMLDEKEKDNDNGFKYITNGFLFRIGISVFFSSI